MLDGNSCIVNNSMTVRLKGGPATIIIPICCHVFLCPVQDDKVIGVTFIYKPIAMCVLCGVDGTAQEGGGA